MQTSDERKEAEVEEVAGVVVGTDVNEAEEEAPTVLSGVQIGPGAEQAKEEQAEESMGLDRKSVV